MSLRGKRAAGRDASEETGIDLRLMTQGLMTEGHIEGH
jgi:hypothetical protein